MRTKLLLGLVLVALNCGAQKHDNVWVFGFGVGLDFTVPGGPAVFQTPISAWEMVGSFADSLGELKLVFQSGENHPVFGYQTKSNFLNGFFENFEEHFDSSIGIGGYQTSRANISDPRGLVFLPSPGNDSIAYAVYIKAGSAAIYPLTIGYSSFNIVENNGKGKGIEFDIEQTPRFATQIITATKHANGKDWWIIGFKWDDNQIIKLLLTENGFEGPFLQRIGSIHHSTSPIYGGVSIGSATFNRKGNKLLYADEIGVVDLFDFDRCTGELSNWRFLGIPGLLVPPPVRCPFGNNVPRGVNLLQTMTAFFMSIQMRHWFNTTCLTMLK